MVFLRQILHNNRQRKERMKKFLITTMLGIATTAAFGAASLRAPQIGGTATVTTPTATNTARAGTLRAQTMKTSSVSTPSVTTTQSIATPVSTETTDARIALLKGIKGFNPGKIKDTTATTSELNSLNDRIEELTAQLDRAEAAQSSVITEANIDAKIEQKLTALGASTSTKETYSKEEVDALLNDIKKKLPVIDNDRGSINIFGTNGELISVPYLKYWLIGDYTESQYPYSVSRYTYRGTPSETTMQNWEEELCQQYNNVNDLAGCCTAPLALNMFLLYRLHNGYLATFPQVTTLSDGRYVLRQSVKSFQYTDTESIRTAICGNLSVNECWVIEDEQNPLPPICGLQLYKGNSYQVVSPGAPRYYLMQVTESFGIPRTLSLYQIYPRVSVSNETLDEWEGALCEPYSDELACCLTTNDDNTFDFAMSVLHNGYRIEEMSTPRIVTLSNGKRALKQGVSSFQYTDTASIQAAVCGTASTNDCWVEEWENHGPIEFSCGLSMYSGYAYWAM